MQEYRKGILLLPPWYEEVDGPLIFLAGPIQGSLDWQECATDFLQTLNPLVHIASPRRTYLDDEFIYETQVDWETHYLRKSSLILFWLAKEAAHICERAYAQTTRLELGEWMVRHQLQGKKLVLGIEQGYTGEKYVRRRFGQDCPDVSIFHSLEETCQKALEYIS